jgi:hypothetical protein
MTWKDYVNREEIRKNQILYNQNKEERVKYLLEQQQKQKQIERQRKLIEEELAEKQKLKQEKLERKKRLEEFRGEYMDYKCSCGGKLKVVYTKWSTTHFAKSICESCDRFDRWIPKPKPDEKFK